VKDFAKGALKFLGVTAVILGAVGAVIYFAFIQLVDVGHNGMAPTMIMGDKVLVWETDSFELGDPVLCGHPETRGRYVMGRIVGRPGHTVAIERGSLLISGDTPDSDVQGTMQFRDAEIGRTVTMHYGVEDLLDHDHPFMWREGTRPQMGRPVRVSGGYFLLGDNRTHRGEDSRSFGVVRAADCVGVIFMRLTAAESPPEIGNAPLDIIR
jgi:signal peptidase I